MPLTVAAARLHGNAVFVFGCENALMQEVNQGLSSIEQTATDAARGASAGIDGMTASMMKGASGDSAPFRYLLVLLLCFLNLPVRALTTLQSRLELAISGGRCSVYPSASGWAAIQAL